MEEFNYNKARWELANTMLRLPDESRTAFERRVHQTAWELGREHYARQREMRPETYREAYEREYEASYQADTRPVHNLSVRQELNSTKQNKLNKAKDKFTR